MQVNQILMNFRGQPLWMNTDDGKGRTLVLGSGNFMCFCLGTFGVDMGRLQSLEGVHLFVCLTANDPKAHT